MHPTILFSALTLVAGALALPATAPSSPSPATSSSSSLDADLKPAHKIKNPILLLRHGEKKRDGSVGLNAAGKKRAECLRRLLGKDSAHTVGLILAESFDPKTKKRRRPFETVRGLARDLGLEVDTECEVDDAKCVRRKVERYVREGGTGEVVVCWKHSMLHVIARELGAKTSPYPDERYDIMWTLRGGRIVQKESERCAGLDAQHPKKHDPDLEIDVDLAEEEMWQEEKAASAEGGQLALGGWGALEELD